MDKELLARIQANPSYQELVTKRTGFGLKLTIIMLVMYYAFILIIAFDKSILGASLSGGVTTVGIPIGMGIIIISFVLTGIYTKRANGEFDDLAAKVKDDAMRGH
jgi:uncharacterized membrane protein (DUF485 family)